MAEPRLGGGHTHSWVVSYLHVRWLSRADFTRLRKQYPRIMNSIRLWILWRGVRHFMVQNYRAQKFGEVLGLPRSSAEGNESRDDEGGDDDATATKEEEDVHAGEHEHGRRRRRRKPTPSTPESDGSWL